MRVLVRLSYDGSKFQGFQRQKHTNSTVANTLEEVLKKLGINSCVIASGRTDKGVHASNQALHIDLPNHWRNLENLKRVLNHHLNPTIFIKKITRVKDDFHSRFWAKKREYRYIFHHGQFSPFLASYVAFYPDFELERLNEILALFKGRHNFEYFKKNGSDTKDFKRQIFKIKAIKHKDKTIISIQADGFLRSQIRMILAITIKAYEEKITKNQIKEQLAKQKIYSQELFSPNGLYLHRIFYDKDIYL